MSDYKQVLATAELALVKGEYHFCIIFLSPLIESFPLSSKECVNLRTILITALCGINNKDEAKKFCKELLKSNFYEVKENAKYLMEIIDSPEIKKPDNWNISLETNPSHNKISFNSIKSKKANKDKYKERFINISNIPTGETKSFQKGFIFIILFLLLLLIPLLSGCVKIENTLDLSEIDSINNVLKIDSKYISKTPWQINFEKEMKEIIPYSELLIGESDFTVKNQNLNLENTKEILSKIQKTAGELAGISTDLKIKTIEKNLFILKNYNYKIDIDLQNLDKIDDLELIFNIINSNRVHLLNKNANNLEASKNIIKWNLIPGKINSLEFSFWKWNKLLIGSLLIIFIISIAYFVKFYRYQLGSDLPTLPSK